MYKMAKRNKKSFQGRKEVMQHSNTTMSKVAFEKMLNNRGNHLTYKEWRCNHLTNKEWGCKMEV